VLVLRGTDGESAPVAAEPRLFPSTFRESGFVARSVTLDDEADATVSTIRLQHQFGGTGTAWLVARCDTGSITVQAGSVSSSRQCTGRPFGVAALGLVTDTGSLDVVATVSEPQQSSWGVAVYR
jgi:hypothetical protein